jgi:hypothetical protein
LIFDLSFIFLGWNERGFAIDAKITKVPAYVGFALTWSQNTNYYSDVFLAFDEDLIGLSYVASGIYNSSIGVSNNVDLSLERFTYLNKGEDDFSERWVSSTSTTSYYLYTASESREILTCDGDTALQHTKSCTPDVNLCGSDLRNHQYNNPCALMSVIYLTINSILVSKFAEVDPVQWGEIIGSLGGYWVYVGAAFGLLFAIRKGTIPSGVLKQFMLSTSKGNRYECQKSNFSTV